MTVFTEGKLQLTVNDAVTARKFDDHSHGMSHCMKAVDFVIEHDDHYVFIEFKDPQNPGDEESEADNFIEQFKSGKIDEDFKYKYRDSFLYEWMSGRAEKPIDYFVLFALDSLETALLSRRTDDMNRKLPLPGPGGQAWCRPFVRSCAVFNIASWNKNLPQYPVVRLSQ